MSGLRLFREEARTWLRANIPPGPPPEDGQASRAHALAWQKRQYEGGWAGLLWPVAYGGRGLTTEQQIIWFEEYALAGAPSTHNASFVGNNHAGPTLIACGTDAQKAYHLPRILSGDVIWCQGFSEPGAGSDLASLRTRGRVQGDEIVVDGHKIWSSYADIADWQELLIRTDTEAAPHHGLSWVICPMDAPGITVRPIRTMAGPRKFSEIFYDGVRIPLANVVGGLNNGWRTAMSTLGFERGTASLALQISLVLKVEELLAACPVNHAPLRHRLALLRAEAGAMRAMTYRFAIEAADGVPGPEGSMIRLQFAELAKEVGAAAIELYGLDGDAVLGSHGWAHDYLDSFSETIAGGTAEIQRNIIGERVLGLPKGPR